MAGRTLARNSDLNARQKENFTFQKVSAVLADFGFVTLRLNGDWSEAAQETLHLVRGRHHLLEGLDDAGIPAILAEPIKVGCALAPLSAREEIEVFCEYIPATTLRSRNLVENADLFEVAD